MQTRRKFFKRILQSVGALAVVPFLSTAQAAKPETPPWIKMPEFDGRVEYLSIRLARSLYIESTPNQVLQDRTLASKLYREYAIGIQNFKSQESTEVLRLLWSIVNRHLEEERKRGQIVHWIRPEVHAFKYDPNVDKFERRKSPKRWLARAYLRYAVNAIIYPPGPL